MKIKNCTAGLVNLQDLSLPDGRIGITLGPNETIVIFDEDAEKSVSFLNAYKQSLIKEISLEEPYEKEIGFNPELSDKIKVLINQTRLNDFYVGFVYDTLKTIITHTTIYVDELRTLKIGVTNINEVVDILADDVTVTLSAHSSNVRIHPTQVTVKNGTADISFQSKIPQTVLIKIENDKGLQNRDLTIDFIFRPRPPRPRDPWEPR